MADDSPLWWTDASGTAHESCRVLVYIGSDYLGEFPFDPGDHPELGWRRSGVSYYCSWCAEIWARLVLLDSGGRQLPLDAERIACDRHPESWRGPAGSILGPVESLLELLPPDAVRREFALHINAALREE